MQTTDFSQVRNLFERCLDLSDDARRDLLECEAADASIRRRAEAMLAADAIEVPALDGFAERASLLLDASPAEAMPPRIGEFEVVRELGRGGMGAVYLAKQTAPERLVAIKRIGRVATADALDRFRREANLLGRLQHPGIAAIHGVGHDEHDQPYLIMEYVEGRPLREFAQTLPRDAQLRLLADLCDAVDHAHSRGVIHRDLKPGNILVTADGRPKVLDFGIARLVEAEGEAPLTVTGMLLGTPAFMSPEQAGGAVDRIGPASDVYSLGVIGYELLSHRLPISVSGLPPLQAMRAIAEETPPPLSRIVPALKGDLELIFETALAKDPAMRYRSAAAFGDDLRRFLGHETLRARRPSTAYRFLMFARRKPGLVASLAFALIALVAGSATATWFALGQRTERVRAESALVRAESTLRFLTDLLAEADPARSGRPDVAVKDILDRALPRVEALPEAAQPPLLLVLADTLANFGGGSRVTPLYERAVALSTAHGINADGANARYGSHLLDMGRLRDVRETLTPLLAKPDLALDVKQRRRAIADLGRAEALLSNADVSRRLREQLEREPGPPLAPGEVPPEFLLAREEIFTSNLDFEQRVPLYTPLLERSTKQLGENHPFVLSLRRFESEMKLWERDDVGALASAQSTFERHRQVLGDLHPATITSKAWLGVAYLRQGDVPKALEVLQAAQAEARQALPASSTVHLEIVALMTRSRELAGQTDKIIEEGESIYERFCLDASALHKWCGDISSGLAFAHALQDRHESADAWLTRTVEYFTRRLGPNHHSVIGDYVGVGYSYALNGRSQRALELAAEAEDLLSKQPDPALPSLVMMHGRLASLYNRIGRAELALPHARVLYAATQAGVSGGWQYTPSARIYALALLGSGQWDEAERVALDAWHHEQSITPQWVDRLDAARTLAKVYRDAGKHDKAEHWIGVSVGLIDGGAFLSPRDTETWTAVEDWRKRHPAAKR